MAQTMSGQAAAGEERGGGTAVQDKAQEAVEQARGQAQRVAEQASEHARRQVDERSTQAGERLRSQADDLRTIGQELRNQGKDGPARLADQVAERTERVGTWLRESDGDRILHDAEDFGRRNPWAVVAGGAIVGFMASRFLKASSGNRYALRRADGGDGRVASDARFQTPRRTTAAELDPHAPLGPGRAGTDGGGAVAP